MESKHRAREDRASSSLVPFPTDARFPAQAIRGFEFRLREHEVGVGRNLRREREVELRKWDVRFYPQESTKHKAKVGASTSSSPTPKPATSLQSQQQASTNKSTKQAKQGGQQNKSRNTGGNGESRADVQVTVGVTVHNLDKNKVVPSSGTAVRALKANKSGGNNKVIEASKGKPQGRVKKY